MGRARRGAPERGSGLTHLTRPSAVLLDMDGTLVSELQRL